MEGIAASAVIEPCRAGGGGGHCFAGVTARSAVKISTQFGKSVVRLAQANGVCPALLLCACAQSQTLHVDKLKQKNPHILGSAPRDDDGALRASSLSCAARSAIWCRLRRQAGRNTAITHRVDDVLQKLHPVALRVRKRTAPRCHRNEQAAEHKQIAVCGCFLPTDAPKQ